VAALPARSARLGWIGAGRMGVPLASRLLRAGCDLTVYNRTRAKAEPLVELGAAVVDSAAALAEADVVFVIVAGPDDLRSVIAGEGGLLSRPDAAPRIVVDLSTVSAEASADVRAAAGERGASFLAAPVSGNPNVARAGRLTFVVSGPRAAFDAVQPYLELLGQGATYVGEGELARLVKIAHNLLLGVVAETVAEITVLAEKGGVPRASFLEFLNSSVMGSTFTRYKTPALVKLDWTPTFTPPLLRKDFDLGLEAARSLGVSLPVCELVRAKVQELIDRGYGDVDFAALLQLRADAAGLELVPEDAPVDDGLGTPAPSAGRRAL
jgi:3-hydroxyisobutyrate dehydrogenase-like beta-hydroxyacid dehydrogenase